MVQDQEEIKKFLEQQLHWCKKQDAILQEINEKLQEMKSIAEYSLEHELDTPEIDTLNRQLNDLKHDVHVLEIQLQGVIH